MDRIFIDQMVRLALGSARIGELDLAMQLTTKLASMVKTCLVVIDDLQKADELVLVLQVEGASRDRLIEIIEELNKLNQ